MRRRRSALAGRAVKYGPKLPPFKVPTESVRWLMGKVHCGTPDSEVKADAMKRANKANWFGKPLTAAQKKKVVDAFLKAHHENQRMYCNVMTGSFGSRRKGK
jgi:hypothetical protein